MTRAVPESNYQQENSAPGGRVIASQHGDVYYWHFEGASTAYLVERFSGDAANNTARLGMTLPSRLLGATYQVVPFFGRDSEREQLGGWSSRSRVTT